MKTLLGSLVLFSLVACGGAKEAPASSASSVPSAAPAADGSPEGGDCSDDVAVQKKCAAGLVCTPKPDAPVSEHTPGVCRKP